VFLRPTFAHVARVRLAPERVEEAVAEVRSLLRERGIPLATWWLGAGATPGDLLQRLEALGLELRERAAGLVLERPPAGAPALEARPAATLEEYTAAQEVEWEVTGTSPDSRARMREDLPGRWQRHGEYERAFVVEDGGAIVSVGRSRYGEGAVFLTGAATAQDARGRGAYTALVHARWHDAVARGVPRLVTQGGPMSAPILRRLGFVDVGDVVLYADRL
jgi:hypothetical protein